MEWSVANHPSRSCVVKTCLVVVREDGATFLSSSLVVSILCEYLCALCRSLLASMCVVFASSEFQSSDRI